MRTRAPARAQAPRGQTHSARNRPLRLNRQCRPRPDWRRGDRSPMRQSSHRSAHRRVRHRRRRSSVRRVRTRNRMRAPRHRTRQRPRAHPRRKRNRDRRSSRRRSMLKPFSSRKLFLPDRRPARPPSKPSASTLSRSHRPSDSPHWLAPGSLPVVSSWKLRHRRHACCRTWQHCGARAQVRWSFFLRRRS